MYHGEHCASAAKTKTDGQEPYHTSPGRMREYFPGSHRHRKLCLHAVLAGCARPNFMVFAGDDWLGRQPKTFRQSSWPCALARRRPRRMSNWFERTRPIKPPWKTRRASSMPARAGATRVPRGRHSDAPRCTSSSSFFRTHLTCSISGDVSDAVR